MTSLPLNVKHEPQEGMHLGSAVNGADKYICRLVMQQHDPSAGSVLDHTLVQATQPQVGDVVNNDDLRVVGITEQYETYDGAEPFLVYILHCTTL